MEPEKLIGKKVKGFKFEETEDIAFNKQMEEYIGVIGVIEKIYKKDVKISFKDDSFFYPLGQIEAHLVEDEIPTLSDGVMMLVSNNEVNWEKREVFFKYDNKVYAKISENYFTWYYFCKPLEPTKEEQLKAILGSDDKVSEIMELFKN